MEYRDYYTILGISEKLNDAEILKNEIKIIIGLKTILFFLQAAGSRGRN